MLSHSQRLWAFGVVCVVVYVSLFLFTGVSAQVVVDDENDDAGVLAQLDDDEYFVRQAATRRLLTDETLTQEDLDRLFLASESLEQRHRLLRVARHHLLRRMIAQRFNGPADPGSMGLSHVVVHLPADEDGGEPRAGVMAALTLPGFPAYALLEPGDVIIEFDGQPIPGKMLGAAFPNMIRSRQAGQDIWLTVFRNGETERIRFRLGNGLALSEVYGTKSVALNEPYRQAWQTQRARMEGLVNDREEPDADATDSPAAPPQ